MALLASFLVLGVLHGLGPDHCAAIASLLVRARPALGGAGNWRPALGIAVSFGLGHAAVLALGVLFAAIAGVAIPEAWSQRSEVLGGVLLLGLGGLLVWRAIRGESRDHAHPHLGPRVKGGGTAMLGALFAFSGIRAAVLVIPLALRGAVVQSFVAVVLFGLGVIVGMAAFGVAVAGGVRVARRLPHGALDAAAGVLALGVGVYWIVSNAGQLLA